MFLENILDFEVSKKEGAKLRILSSVEHLEPIEAIAYTNSSEQYWLLVRKLKKSLRKLSRWIKVAISGYCHLKKFDIHCINSDRLIQVCSVSSADPELVVISTTL